MPPLFEKNNLYKGFVFYSRDHRKDTANILSETRGEEKEIVQELAESHFLPDLQGKWSAEPLDIESVDLRTS